MSSRMTPNNFIFKRPDRLPERSFSVPGTSWGQGLKRIIRSPLVLAAMFIFIAILVTAIVIPAVSPHSAVAAISPTAQTDSLSGQAILREHLANISPCLASSRCDTTKYVNGSFVSSLRNLGVTFAIVSDYGDGTYDIRYDFNEVLRVIGYRPVSIYLGTDSIGRDIWTMVWHALRRSIGLALITALLAAVIGVAAGSYLGIHAGRRRDTYLMRFIEIFASIPMLLLLIIMTYIFKPAFWASILIFTLIFWVHFVSITRALVIRVKDQDFVRAAQSFGTRTSTIIMKHIMPSIIGRLLLVFAELIPILLLTEATLAIVGLVGSDVITLGSVIDQARRYPQNAYYMLVPTLGTVLVTLSLHFVGVGISEALPPWQRRQRKWSAPSPRTENDHGA